MKSYRLTPEKNKRPALVLCVTFLGVAFLCFFTSSLFPVARAVGQFLAAVFLLLFIQITTKFLLTEYTYTLEEDTLYLQTLQGKRIKNLGGISLSKNCRLLSETEWKKNKKSYALTARFSCCQNLFTKRQFVLLCPTEGTYTALFFEPDETMEFLIRSIIEQ